MNLIEELREEVREAEHEAMLAQESCAGMDPAYIRECEARASMAKSRLMAVAGAALTLACATGCKNGPNVSVSLGYNGVSGSVTFWNAEPKLPELPKAVEAAIGGTGKNPIQ